MKNAKNTVNTMRIDISWSAAFCQWVFLKIPAMKHRIFYILVVIIRPDTLDLIINHTHAEKRCTYWKIWCNDGLIFHNLYFQTFLKISERHHGNAVISIWFKLLSDASIIRKIFGAIHCGCNPWEPWTLEDNSEKSS